MRFSITVLKKGERPTWKITEQDAIFHILKGSVKSFSLDPTSHKVNSPLEQPTKVTNSYKLKHEPNRDMSQTKLKCSTLLVST